MIYIISLIIPILAFIFEIYPRLINRNFGVDIWTHLLYLKEYHVQKKIPKNIRNGFLISGDYDYPPIFILILSRFSSKLVEKYEFLFSPFFDFLLLIFTYFISYFLTGNIHISLLTQIIYALTPIIILENSSATPRSLGYSLFTVLFFSLFLFVQNGLGVLLLIAIICGTLIFLSHRFTAQGFLFFSLFFSVIEKRLIYFEVFALSFILSIFLSKGFYLKVLRGHLGNLVFWYKNIKYRFYHQIKGSFKEHKTKDFIFKIYNQFLKFPPFVLLITNPWTSVPLYMFFLERNFDPLTEKLLFWIIFSYTLAIITTWIPILRFLGEGQRYLELSAFPAAFLSSTFLFKHLNINNGLFFTITYILVGVASFITIIVIQRKGIIKDNLRTVTPDMERMFVFLKNLDNKPKLLCIPHQITTSTIYHTGCSVFVNANYKDIQKIADVYPYFKKPIIEIMRKYNLEMILLNEEYAEIKDLKISSYKIIKRVGNFVLLKV
jgi:hypothetical protein